MRRQRAIEERLQELQATQDERLISRGLRETHLSGTPAPAFDRRASGVTSDGGDALDERDDIQMDGLQDEGEESREFTARRQGEGVLSRGASHAGAAPLSSSPSNIASTSLGTARSRLQHGAAHQHGTPPQGNMLDLDEMRVLEQRRSERERLASAAAARRRAEQEARMGPGAVRDSAALKRSILALPDKQAAANLHHFLYVPTLALLIAERLD